MSATPDPSFQPAYYDRLWAEVPAARLNWHELARREAIENALGWLSAREPTPWSIAEVGCGRGWLSGLVLSAYGNVEAFDISPDSVAKAQEAFPNVRWQVRDVFDAPLPPTHDLVVSSEVIEHIVDQHAFVERLVSGTRSRGWLLITTPNGRVEREYQRRPDFRPQPIEKWLDTGELAALLEPTCHVARLETVLFGQVRGPLQRLARSRAAGAARNRLRGRDPLSRICSRARLGLYTLLLAQRRT